MCNRRSVSTFFLLLFVFCVYGGEAYAVTDRCPRHQVVTELKAKLKKTKKFRASISEINDYFDNHDRSSGTVLAFVSYGGNSLLICSVAVAILLRVDFENRLVEKKLLNAEDTEIKYSSGTNSTAKNKSKKRKS